MWLIQFDNDSIGFELCCAPLSPLLIDFLLSSWEHVPCLGAPADAEFAFLPRNQSLILRILKRTSQTKFWVWFYLWSPAESLSQNIIHFFLKLVTVRLLSLRRHIHCGLHHPREWRPWQTLLLHLGRASMVMAMATAILNYCRHACANSWDEDHEVA